MSVAAVQEATRLSRAVGGTLLGVAGATAAWAHPGHPIGDQLLAESLHAGLGMHWAVVEPILMLAAIVAASKLTGWVLVRVAAWGGTRRRAFWVG